MEQYIVAIVIGALFLITLLQGIIWDARSGSPCVKWYSRIRILLVRLLMTGLMVAIAVITGWVVKLAGGLGQINMLIGGLLLLVQIASIGGIVHGLMAILSVPTESSNDLCRRFGQGPYQP